MPLTFAWTYPQTEPPEIRQLLCEKHDAFAEMEIKYGDLTAFAQRFPEVADDKKLVLHYAKKLLNEFAIRNQQVDAASFVAYASRHLPQRVLSMQTNFHTLWNLCSEWMKFRRNEEPPWKGDNGWHRHAIRLMARYKHWRLTGHANWINPRGKKRARVAKEPTCTERRPTPCAAACEVRRAEAHACDGRSSPSLLARDSCTLPLASTTPRPHEAAGLRNPPSAPLQFLRTAARIPPLLKYLKHMNKFSFMDTAHWRCIRVWCLTPSGVNWLQTAGLDPLSFHLHHVKARESGGMYSVFNCVFLPGSANGWFGKLDSREMRAYVGAEAARISDLHAKWVASKAVAANVDQTAFDMGI